ncbi:MAG: hypothetical protein JNM17_04830 [Archangium sp.]|nr:hypothetical protein [Archangium sp.]
MPLAALALVSVVLAAPPKPVAEAAAALDGAKRSINNKECTFTVEKVDCALAVRTSCATQLMKYSYVTTVPLGKVDVKQSAVQPNAGGFSGSHGVEVTTTGDVIETVTDEGQKTSGSTVVFALGTTDDDLKRARKFFSALSGAKNACKGK